MSQQKPHAAARKWFHRAVAFLNLKEGQRGPYMNQFRKRDVLRKYIDRTVKATIHGMRPMITSR